MIRGRGLVLSRQLLILLVPGPIFFPPRWQEYIDAAVKDAGGASDSQRFYANRTSEAPIQTNLTKTSAGVTIIKPASPDEEGQGRETIFILL